MGGNENLKINDEIRSIDFNIEPSDNTNLDRNDVDSIIVHVLSEDRLISESKEAKAQTLPIKLGKPLSNPITNEDFSAENKAGEMGIPVSVSNPDEETKKKIDDGWRENAFNSYVSDMISVNRSLPDPRDDWCKAPDRNLKELPVTSVIVVFHNEAWSTLLRTVHSIIDQSPEHLLKEIILVDDASTDEHVKFPLNQYMEKFPKVKIIRASERSGLIRARLIGAKVSTAPVLTFLDSHCECMQGWLEPLLDRIARNVTTVVVPIVDTIDDDSFEWRPQEWPGSVGGFDWGLTFNWHPTPEHEKSRHNHTWEPVWSPTMPGGLFAIDKEFFERLGTYDPEMDIWGGENLELSFKTWMCGGTLEIVPCSHVGHVFRKRSPYKWRKGVGNTLQRNLLRLAEVWLDDYKQYYYERIGNMKLDFGDVTSRRKLRSDLQCESFQWYLDTVFPELFIPGDAVASGEIRNSASQHCIDSPAKEENLNKFVGLFPCHNLGGNQYWSLSKTGEIRRDEYCLDSSGLEVILFACHGSRGNQLWQYQHENKMLWHGHHGKCLTISKNTQNLTLEMCDVNELRQMWKFGSYQGKPTKVSATLEDVPLVPVITGAITNPMSLKCLDSLAILQNQERPVGLWPCHNQGGNQHWMLSEKGEIRQHEVCMDYSGEEILLLPCHGDKGNQFWKFQHENRTLWHQSSTKCLMIGRDNKDTLTMEECNASVEQQMWMFDNHDLLF